MLKRMGNWILTIDNIFASIAITLIISVTTIGVFMRFVLGDPLKWTEEVSLGLFVWFTFLGASVVAKEDGHVSIDYFVEKLNPFFKNIAYFFREILMIILNVFVFIYLGFQLTAQAADKLTPILRLSYIYIDIAVVLCGVFSTIHIIIRMVSRNKNRKTLMVDESNVELTSGKGAEA